MSLPDMESRELFLEDCVLLSDSWTEKDDENLNEFLFSPSGKKVLGKLQLMWKRELFTVAGISCHDPHSAAASLSNTQGKIRGIMMTIDRLFEMEPPNALE